MVTPTPLLLVKVISELRTLDSNKVKYTSQKKMNEKTTRESDSIFEIFLKFKLFESNRTMCSLILISIL